MFVRVSVLSMEASAYHADGRAFELERVSDFTLQISLHASKEKAREIKTRKVKTRHETTRYTTRYGTTRDETRRGETAADEMTRYHNA